jgi:4-amino-4-deoxy-L-arabinose transferase-like glycosyltransferase
MRLVVGLIVFAALVRGLVWAVALPPWQGPDEPVHFSYIQRIANDHTLPAFDHGPPDYFSVATNASVYTTGYLPSRTREPLRKLRRDLPAFPPELDGFPEKNHGALLGVWKYPPAYDLLATPAYLLPGLHTDTERMYAVRAVSVVLGALAVWLVYLLLIEAGAGFLIAVMGALAYSLLPMVSQASAIGNPDILLMAAIAGLTYALLKLRRGWTWGRAIPVALWALLALLTKPIGGPAALLIIVPLLAFVPAWRSLPRRFAAAGALVAAIVVCYVAMAVAATWQLFGVAGPATSLRYALSYLWQFYFPPLSFMDSKHAAYHAFPSLPSWRVWIETGTGYFGWLTTPMPSWAYNLAFWSLVAAALVAIAAAIAKPDRRTGAALALLLAGLANVLLLHLAEVLALIQGSPELLLQGRYLIDVIPLFVAALFQPYARIGRVGLVAAGGVVLVTAVLSLEAMNSVLVFFG